ncbi:MAG: LPP20 family lipoprotein [Colwellia sp.]|nr:LPP20 family lipoprotein [Colwellia sp.]
MLKQLVVFILTLLVGNSIALAGDVIQGSETGGINWSKGTVFASGYGVASDNTPNRKKRLLARRAAQVDAYRNLAEIISGVRINSETIVEDLEATSDIIRTKLNAIIKGALITKDIYQNEIAQVIIEVKMDGSFIETVSNKAANKFGLNHLPDNNVLSNIFLDPDLANKFSSLLNSFFINSLMFNSLMVNSLMVNKVHAATLPGTTETVSILRDIQSKVSQLSKDESLKYISAKIASFENTSQYSGLLIDAQAIDQFELATIPRLRTSDGKVIYPTPEMLTSNAFRKRPVSYDFDVNDAIENKRIAYTPYVVKAIGTYKSRHSDLVVSDEVALFIKNNIYFANTLDKASVMIVIAQ